MNDSYCDSDDGIQAPTIVIQPRIRQFVADELLLLAVFTGAMAGYAAFEGMTKSVFLAVILIDMAWLFCRYLDFARKKYIITSEQVIYLHGMFMQLTDYMELYRIVDYQESRGLLQQILGLKTLRLYSGDMSLPELDIIGLNRDEDIVSQIRYRVEVNKHRRHIYEITNHY